MHTMYAWQLACLARDRRREFDRLSAAARSGETQLVANVHAFPGHIACDAAAQSELVVPLTDREGCVFAVLDLDSHQAAAFDQVDREEIERLAREISPHLSAA